MIGGSGVFETWKDSTPTYAAAYGLAVPTIAAGNDIQFSTYSSGVGWNSRMTILNNGNVGIGTTSPGYKLDDQGSLNATSYYLSGTAVTINRSDIPFGYVGTPGATALLWQLHAAEQRDNHRRRWLHELRGQHLDRADRERGPIQHKRLHGRSGHLLDKVRG